MVGNGWYKGIFGFICILNYYGDRVVVFVEIYIVYMDGIKEIIVIDKIWQVIIGFICLSEIYMGEIYDFCFYESQFFDVEMVFFDKNCFVVQENEFVKIIKRFFVFQLIIIFKGEYVIDFG